MNLRFTRIHGRGACLTGKRAIVAGTCLVSCVIQAIHRDSLFFHDMTLCYIRVRFLLRSLLSVSPGSISLKQQTDRLLRCSCLWTFGGVRGKCPPDCEYRVMSKGTVCNVWWSVHYESLLQLAEIRKAVMSGFLCSVALHWLHCLHEFCLMCVILGIGAYLVLVILDRVNISHCVLWRVFCRWIRIVSGKFNFGRCAGTIRDDRFLQSKL